MFSMLVNVSKAKRGFLNHHHVQKNTEYAAIDEFEKQKIRTLEQMAKEEAHNPNVPIEKRFFGQLNEIFFELLGPTIRREFNYFLVSDLVEETILSRLSSIDEEELWEYAIKILRKDSENRLFEEVIILQKITEQVEALRSIRRIKGREILFSCLKELRYKYGKIGTYLQKQGEPIKSMYIILKGLVQIRHVNRKDDLVDDAQSPKSSVNAAASIKHQKKQIKMLNGVKVTDSNLLSSKFEQTFEELQSTGGSQLASKSKCTYIHKGQSYGDQQLLSQEEVIADNQAYLFDNCHLAVLDLLKFKIILDESIVANLQKEVSEFNEMNVLKEMDLKFVSGLFMRCKLVTFSRNHALTREGDQFNEIYFLKEGEVKLDKKLLYDSEPTKKQAIRSSLEVPNEFQLPLHQTVSHFDIAILIKGQNIGLEELFKGESVYIASGTVYSSTATFYRLSKSDLVEAFEIDKEAHERMSKFFTSDQEYHKKRVRNYNEFFGKLDITSKQAKEKEENELNNKRSDSAIKRDLRHGQDQIMKSNLNINSLNIQPSPQSLEYIMSTLKEAKNKHRNRFNKKDKNSRFDGMRFSENDLHNINLFASRARKSLDFNSMTPVSPKQSTPMHHQHQSPSARESTTEQLQKSMSPHKYQVEFNTNNSSSIIIINKQEQTKSFHIPLKSLLHSQIGSSKLQSNTSMSNHSALMSTATFSTPFRLKIGKSLNSQKKLNSSEQNQISLNQENIASLNQQSMDHADAKYNDDVSIYLPKEDDQSQQLHKSLSISTKEVISISEAAAVTTSAISPLKSNKQKFKSLSQLPALLGAWNSAEKKSFQHSKSLAQQQHSFSSTARNSESEIHLSRQSKSNSFLKQDPSPAVSPKIHHEHFNSQLKGITQYSKLQYLPLKYHTNVILDPKECFLTKLYKDTQKRSRQLRLFKRPESLPPPAVLKI